MYFHIVRLSANHQVRPIGLPEWEAFVEQQEDFYWTEASITSNNKNEAIYFMNTQDKQGMDWHLREDGTFKFKNTKLPIEHPYIQKITEVAQALDAQVVRGDVPTTRVNSAQTVAPLVNRIPATLPYAHQTVAVSPLVNEATAFSQSSPVLENTSLNVDAHPKEAKLPPASSSIMDVKAKSTRKLSHRAKSQLKPPPAIKKLVLHTQEAEFHLGGSFQGDLIVPLVHNQTEEEDDACFRIRNIWLAVIKVQGDIYTFEIETAFVVEVNQDNYFYQEKSKIVANRDRIEVSDGRKIEYNNI